MLTFPARYSRWLPLAAGAVLVFLFLHLRHPGFGLYKPQAIGTEPSVIISSNQTITTPDDIKLDIKPVDANPTSATCRPLPGIEDILVILKTGITEAQEKVPVHVRSTLRCIPNKLIVSDYEEEIDGIHTYDVFRNTSWEVRENIDFALYNRAQLKGRAGLTKGDVAKVANSASGMMGNPGWKLDKWKFLPMALEARNYKADAKWYVILEADTYPIWPTLVAWLNQLDSSKKLYLGNQMQIGEDVFAHGGSGVVLSHAAMHGLADEYQNHMDDWHAQTNTHWAGDCIMGMALKAIGIPLTWSWPHVTGQSIWEQDAINEAYGRKQWCYPPFTFHHMTTTDIETMFEFDVKWHADEKNSFLLYKDFFRLLVRPNLTDTRENWDNFAPKVIKKEGDENAPWTHYECAEECAKRINCMQYSIDKAGTCKLSDLALGGRPSADVTSGTMMWRIDERIRSLGDCESPEWVSA
ncbi:hypothetical protein N7507_001278 [Penicillium longicatenatum]|nr:hypothetical protein N7507_001278 [Penicillium longicatenatum]